MIRLLGYAITTLVVLLPDVAPAQKGQQIFDFFLQQADRELQRQQQREYERYQRQELHRLHQQFTAQWQACHRDDLDACDQALAYPYLNFNDRQRLLARRSQIISLQQETAERARQEHIAAELQERRRQREQVELERAQEVARQREAAERIRRDHEQEERRLAELRAFSAEREACRTFDAAACETALDSPHASRQDKNDMLAWRAAALHFHAHLKACESGSVAACDAALASPALTHDRRSRVQGWRAAASPFHQVLSYFATAIGDLPTSTHITGTLAGVLALALAGIAFQARRKPSIGPVQAAMSPRSPCRSIPWSIRPLLSAAAS